MNFFLLAEKFGWFIFFIFFGLVIGKILKRNKDITIKVTTKIVLYISVPGSILFSMSTVKFETIQDKLLILLLCAFSIIIITLLICFPISKIFERDDFIRRRIYRSALFFNNYGFLGWPICLTLFGTEGLLYAVLFTIPMNVFYFTITPLLISGKNNEVKRFDKSILINIPFFSTIVGLIIMIMNIPVPELFLKVFDSVGITQTPLSLIIIGMTISSIKIKDINHLKCYLFSVIRLIIIPLITFVVLKIIGLEGLALDVPVMISAMPAGTMVVVFAQKYNSNMLFASELVINSTLLSIITIPLIALFIIYI